MFAIGDSLREARTRRGLSAADVQKGIRIRERYLTALEEENWDLLPGEAYTKGFLRTYAEFLGLDGNLYIDEYNTQISHADEERPLVPQSLVAVQRTRRGLLRTLMVLLVIGAAVAAFAALGMGGGPSTSGAHNKTPAVKHVKKAAAAVAVPAATAKPAAAPLPTTVIRASRGRSWLLIRTGTASGPIVYQGVLPQGESLHFSLRHQDLWLRMGRPQDLDVVLGGRLVTGLPAQAANLLLTRSGAKAA
jgi:transcriptional regulator with XRE-family HTH domain